MAEDDDMTDAFCLRDLGEALFLTELTKLVRLCKEPDPVSYVRRSHSINYSVSLEKPLGVERCIQAVEKIVTKLRVYLKQLDMSVWNAAFLDLHIIIAENLNGHYVMMTRTRLYHMNTPIEEGLLFLQ